MQNTRDFHIPCQCASPINRDNIFRRLHRVDNSLNLNSNGICNFFETCFSPKSRMEVISCHGASQEGLKKLSRFMREVTLARIMKNSCDYIPFKILSFQKVGHVTWLVSKRREYSTSIQPHYNVHKKYARLNRFQDYVGQPNPTS